MIIVSPFTLAFEQKTEQQIENSLFLSEQVKIDLYGKRQMCCCKK